MWSAVIPTYNEEGRVIQVLHNLSSLPLDKIIVIANGCQDQTLAEITEFQDQRLELHVFTSKLGIDIPRAIGAKIALDHGSQVVLFIDGDMIGQFNQQLLELTKKIEQGWDMALLNCYPFIPYRHPPSVITSHLRAILNRKLGLYNQLGIASPSHGPHALSQRFLRTVPLQELAIPPVAMALAHQQNLSIVVAATITHLELDSHQRDNHHSEMVAQTIIGDHLEALSMLAGKARSRFYQGKEMLGYNPERRWDLLEAFLTL